MNRLRASAPCSRSPSPDGRMSDAELCPGLAHASYMANFTADAVDAVDTSGTSLARPSF